jgi:hypothetical protein
MGRDPGLRRRPGLLGSRCRSGGRRGSARRRVSSTSKGVAWPIVTRGGDGSFPLDHPSAALGPAGVRVVPPDQRVPGLGSSCERLTPRRSHQRPSAGASSHVAPPLLRPPPSSRCRRADTHGQQVLRAAAVPLRQPPHAPVPDASRGSTSERRPTSVVACCHMKTGAAHPSPLRHHLAPALTGSADRHRGYPASRAITSFSGG